jgi:hypothetical protein
MGKKLAIGSMAIFLGLFLLTGSSVAGELELLFGQVENLKIERQGYLLGAQLTVAQEAVAAKNPMDAASKKVFKFKDRNLNIVADRVSRRVLVIFELFEKLSQSQVQEIVGELFMAYEEPTIPAHDKVVYWFWGKNAKFTGAQYDMAKGKKKKLAVIATVKFISEIKIMDKKETVAIGDAYYIISSGPMLKFFHDI